MDFGSKALSHPLVVSAIEDRFIPVCIFNNKPGSDAQILARFKEPAWNNPVVRFVSAEAQDIIPRKDRVWTTSALVDRMVAALNALKIPVPSYVTLVLDEGRETTASRDPVPLLESPWRHLPMTAPQVRRVAAELLATKGDPTSWLAPRQRELLKLLEAFGSRADAQLEGLRAPRSHEGWESHEAEVRRRLERGS